MKFPYLVVHNGVEYPVGTDVPIEGAKSPRTDVETVKVDKIPIEEVNPVKNVKSVSYGKTEINRMPIDELKKVAIENGIADANEKSGSELKKELIAKFGL